MNKEIKYYANGMELNKKQFKNLIEVLKAYSIKYVINNKRGRVHGTLIFELEFKDENIIDMSLFEKNDKPDNVNSPSHYTQGKYETIELIEDIVEDFASYCIGNVIKYVSRYKHKNGIEDLEKAKKYLEFLIEKEND